MRCTGFNRPFCRVYDKFDTIPDIDFPEFPFPQTTLFFASFNLIDHFTRSSVSVYGNYISNRWITHAPTQATYRGLRIKVKDSSGVLVIQRSSYQPVQLATVSHRFSVERSELLKRDPLELCNTSAISKLIIYPLRISNRVLNLSWPCVWKCKTMGEWL